MLLSNQEQDVDFQMTVFKLTNEGLEALGDLTQYTSVKWPNAFVGYGSFEVWAPINEENNMYFKKGQVIWNNERSITSSAVVIECIKSIVDEDGSKSFDVKGKTLERFLLDRIIWGTLVFTNKHVSTIMYGIVESQCINPTNPNRKIPWLILDEDKQIGPVVDSYQKTGGQIYDAVNSLATDGDIGFSIYPDQSLMRLVFTVVSGTDRTIEQEENDPVVFETSLQDILTSTYYTNSEDLKNVAFVQGEDTGAARKSVTVGESESAGFLRRELYIDARDIQSEVYDEESGESTTITDEEYLQMLTQRGKEKLTEYYTVETFEAQIRQFGDIQYEYGEDFFLGDKVTVIDDELGVQVSARILEVEQDISDRYELVLKFGYSYPTLLDKVKRETT